MAGQFNLAEVDLRLMKMLRRMLHKVGLVMMRYETMYMKVDTGWSRGHLSYQVDEADMSVKAGILSPFNSQDGTGVALYPAMMEEGIKRHFVPFYATSESGEWGGGQLRQGLINWAVRHGFKVWREQAYITPKAGMGNRRVYLDKAGKARRGNVANKWGLAMKGLWVWGYAHTWRTYAKIATLHDLPNVLREQCENKL